MASSFGPIVNLTEVSKSDVICYYALSDNDYNVKTLKAPRFAYTFARFFGSGVVLATAFIHLLDPAYNRIGPRRCIGESGHWWDYSWCAAIVLASILGIFLLDLAAEVYVERRYGQDKNENAMEPLFTGTSTNQLNNLTGTGTIHYKTSSLGKAMPRSPNLLTVKAANVPSIAAFLILEFGIIVHSVIIGLNLGVTGSEFATLYPVLVFHRSFEGLGIGARMSSIPFGKHTWLPWVLCAAYRLTAPVSIAVGLGVWTIHVPKSKQALMVQGVLNAISAGLLIYSAFVELWAATFYLALIAAADARKSSTCFVVWFSVLEL
ncbi:zinc-regulated transporter 1 [Colletotrichum incanum]|nr:zinc-regulated transporter 1 [Colletotrichum incanum]